MKLARLLPTCASALVAAASLAACQQEAQAPSPEVSASGSEAIGGVDAKPGLSANGGMLVLPAVKGRPGGAYFTLVNNGNKPVTLAAASVEGAGKTEMHETKGGVMSPIVSLDVKPGETVKFERGGKHVMAFDLAGSIAAGGSSEMTLTFADGDKITVPLKVEAAGGAATQSMDHTGEMH